MRQLNHDERDILERKVDEAQKGITLGFLKRWKISSIVGQVNDMVKHNMIEGWDSMGFFRNCMEMEGFNEAGVKVIHDLVMAEFQER